MVLSAACFAIAHIKVFRKIISVLTFLLGLIFGWPFIQARSLLAPILSHGLANACYLLMATVFTQFHDSGDDSGYPAMAI